MAGYIHSWLRVSLLAFAGLMFASGSVWARGGGGHGGGGGHAGGGFGGAHLGGYSHGFGFGGVGGYRGVGIYSPGFYRGLGYSPYFGRGYQYGYGYGLGRGYFGMGYGLGYGFPFYRSGIGYGLGLPYLGYNSGWYGGIYAPYYYGYGPSAYYGYSSAYGGSATPADYGMLASRAQAPPPPKDDLAHLLVVVPENAELWFNGTKTNQTGPQREFVSPELAPGKKYSYEIKARWTENGKPVEQVRIAHVQANNWQVIDFTKPESATQANN